MSADLDPNHPLAIAFEKTKSMLREALRNARYTEIADLEAVSRGVHDDGALAEIDARHAVHAGEIGKVVAQIEQDLLVQALALASNHAQEFAQAVATPTPDAEPKSIKGWYVKVERGRGEAAAFSILTKLGYASIDQIKPDDMPKFISLCRLELISEVSPVQAIA